MPESLGSAVLDLTVNAEGLEDGLEQAEGTTSSRLGAIGGVVGKGAAAVAGAFVAAGGAAIGAAFKTAAYGDEIGKTAPRLGVSTDALQEMRYWADRNGLSTSGMERAVGRLNQRIGDGTAGSSRYVDSLNNMGVATLDLNGNVRDTESVMYDTIEALRGIEDPSVRSAAAAEIFGTKMARDLMPALEEGALSMEEAAAMAHELGIVMGEEQIEASERFTDAWADVKDAGRGLLNEFGAPVMEFLSDTLFPAIVDRVIPAVQQFAEWIGPHLAEAAQWLSEAFDAYVVPAFEWLMDWWDANGPAIMAVAEALWERLQDVFASIGDAVRRVAEIFQGEGGRMEGMMASVRSFAERVWPRIQSIIESAMDIINGIIERVTAIVQGIWERWGDDLMSFAETIWNAIQDVIDGVLQVIQGIFDVFAGIFTGDWERVWEGVKNIGEGIWNIIEGLWDALLGAVELAWTMFSDMITEAWDAMWTWISDKASEIWNNIQAAWELLIQVVTAVLSDFDGTVRNIWDGLWTWASELVSGIWDTISGLWDTLVSAISDALGGFNDTVRDIWDGLWEWAKETVTSAWDDFKEAISGGIDDIIAWMTALPGDLLSALGDLGSILLDAGREIMRGLYDGLKEIWDNTVSSWVGGLASQIRALKGPIEVDRVLLVDAGEEIIGGLGRGMAEEWKQVERLLSDITGDIPLSVSALGTDMDVAGRPAGGQMRPVTVNIHGDVIEPLDEEHLAQMLNRAELLAGVR